MFGFNWVDLVIIFILLDAFFRGMRIGAIVELCTAGSFFAALFLGGWAYPHLLPVHDPTLLVIVNGNLVLLTAVIAAIAGYRFGKGIRVKLLGTSWHKIESGFGVISVTSALVIVWLLAAMLGRLPFAGLSNSANDARIVQALNNVLPPVPAVFAVFNHQIDPNSPPKILTNKPTPTRQFAYSTEEFEAASKAKPSVVKVTGFGCGGFETGSGFVVGEALVATNAHVVAGIKRPIIKYGGTSYEAIPVFFDAEKDFAVLRVKVSVHSFGAPALSLESNNLAVGTTVAILGYPRGDFAARPGLIRSSITISSRTIYDVGAISRPVYGIQMDIDDGNSGGPVVTAAGKVAGMVFAKDNALPNYGYALTAQSILGSIKQAAANKYPVSTGVCVRY
jgi:S1-C subfamily serine protease